MNSKRNKKQKGFTLIELLVVISIIGLMSTLAMTSVRKGQSKSRDARRIADMQAAYKATQLFYDYYGFYPQCWMPGYPGGCDYVVVDQFGTHYGDSSADGTYLGWANTISGPDFKDPTNQLPYIYVYGNGQISNTGIYYDFVVAAILEDPNNQALKSGIPFPGLPEFYGLGERTYGN